MTWLYHVTQCDKWRSGRCHVTPILASHDLRRRNVINYRLRTFLIKNPKNFPMTYFESLPVGSSATSGSGEVEWLGDSYSGFSTSGISEVFDDFFRFSIFGSFGFLIFGIFSVVEPILVFTESIFFETLRFNVPNFELEFETFDFVFDFMLVTKWFRHMIGWLVFTDLYTCT